MKKLYYVLALAAVVATAACNKDEDKNPSKDELIGGGANDWFYSELFGSPKKVVTTDYNTDNLEVDTLTLKVKNTPSAADVESVETVEFNNAGYETASKNEVVVVTKAEFTPNKDYIVVKEVKLFATEQYTNTYDSKNRLTLSEGANYSYTATAGGNTIYNGDYAVGDSIPVWGEAAFEAEVDTNYRSKYEITYDEKTATEISYSMYNGKWEATNKTVYALNKYGNIDYENKQYYRVKPTAAEFETKPYDNYYTEVDGQGNWTLRANTEWYGGNNTYVYNYETREIFY
jgi:hypothetical protein